MLTTSESYRLGMPTKYLDTKEQKESSKYINIAAVMSKLLDESRPFATTHDQKEVTCNQFGNTIRSVPTSISSIMMDESTRQMVLQKTWCHGQAVAPCYGILCVVWFAYDPAHSVGLLYAGIVLPIWSYVSYRAVFSDYRARRLLIGGMFVELAYALVFRAALAAGIQSHTSGSTWHLLMLITSGLFFIETFAFLVVVRLVRGRAGDLRRSTTEVASNFLDEQEISVLHQFQ
jgi:hypothetical protein